MSLFEYLFIDRKRLNAYVQQIQPSGTYDKVPTWKVGLSLTGPQAEGTQTRFPRELTDQEKINALIEYLEKEELIVRGRGAKYDNWFGKRPPFRIEKCKAARALIPGLPDKAPALALWVSHQIPEIPSVDSKPKRWGRVHAVQVSEYYTGEYPSMLFLLEDYNEDDRWKPYIRSSYTSLLMLLTDSNQLRDGSALRDLADHAYKLFDRFALSPFLVLRDLNAEIAEEREVEILYRIRSLSMEEGTFDRSGMNEAARMIIFGYPIFIRAAE
jgi:hypothetical protein